LGYVGCIDLHDLLVLFESLFCRFVDAYRYRDFLLKVPKVSIILYFPLAIKKKDDLSVLDKQDILLLLAHYSDTFVEGFCFHGSSKMVLFTSV
jgi:hypothetical protein